MSTETAQDDYEGSFTYGPASTGDFVKLALNTDDYLYEIKLILYNVQYNETTRSYEQKPGKPLINKTGAKKTMDLVQSVVNRNTFLSNFTDDEIKAKLEITAKTLAADYYLFHNVYWNNTEEAEANTPILLWSVQHALEAALKRAQDGKERDIHGGNTKTLIQRSEMQSKQSVEERSKSGFFR